MPTRAVSMGDDLYADIHDEMKRTTQTFSQVIVRRLHRLKKIDEGEKNAQ